MIFEEIVIWQDQKPRNGPENMAVDEWLLLSISKIPILRIYSWDGPWKSFGYFQSLSVAEDTFGADSNLVRRWTGGGIVDHTNDATYTLVIPQSHHLAELRGCESYCKIHQALAQCLQANGIDCELCGSDSDNDSSVCFENPVRWDVRNPAGQKLAGAGQRRNRKGILHQGSVAVEPRFIENLEKHLAKKVIVFRPEAEPSTRDLSALIGKYSTRSWLARI